MTKEELKALGLDDTQVEAVFEDYGKNYVPKSQFNAKNEELKEIKKEVEVIRKANVDNEALTKQIEALQQASKTREKEYEAKMNALMRDGIVDRAILQAKGKNAKAIKSLLDLEGCKLDGDRLIGLEEQLALLKEKEGYLFEEDKPTVSGVVPGSTNTEAMPTITKEDFNKMSYAEKTDLFLENQELFYQLSQEKGD